MAKRYYTCKIIGDGQSPETAWRPAIQDIVDAGRGGIRAFDFTAVMPPSDPQTGAPTRDWCLVIASGPDHRLAEGNPDVDPLVSASLDVVRLSALKTADKVLMTQRLQARGVDTARFANADAVRDMIDAIGQELQPGFDALKFDVSE
jgi:hypothetical protein